MSIVLAFYFGAGLMFSILSFWKFHRIVPFYRQVDRILWSMAVVFLWPAAVVALAFLLLTDE